MPLLAAAPSGHEGVDDRVVVSNSPLLIASSASSARCWGAPSFDGDTVPLGLHGTEHPHVDRHFGHVDRGSRRFVYRLGGLPQPKQESGGTTERIPLLPALDGLVAPRAQLRAPRQDGERRGTGWFVLRRRRRAAGCARRRGGPRAAQPAPIAEIAKRIPVRGKGNVAAVGGAVWATDGAGTLSRIDPSTNRVVRGSHSVPRSPQLCCAFRVRTPMWIADAAADTVIRVGIRMEGPSSARIPVGRSPVGTAVGFGSVWVANNHGAS